MKKALSPESIFKIIYKRSFKNIYTAKQCCDHNDVVIAIAMLSKLAVYCGGEYTPEMLVRLRALNNKKLKLNK